MKKKIFLIDGTAVIFRSYYGFINNPLTDSNGENVSAIYGFINTMFKLMKKENPDKIAVTFDVGGKHFRHEMYPEYKANRSPAPEDLKSQIPKVIKIASLMGFPVFTEENCEADDVIATLVKKLESTDNDIYIFSKDKDFAQLIKSNVFMSDPSDLNTSNLRIDEEKVKAKFGVEPYQILDYLSLIGDAADNVPGVPGVGPKSASLLLSEYNSLDKIYDSIELITKKALKAKLIANKEKAYLSKQLITLKADIDIDIDILNLPLELFTSKEFIAEMSLYGFKSLIKQLGQTEQSEPETFQVKLEQNYRRINKTSEITDFLKDCSTFAFDTETTGLDVYTVGLVGISLAKENGEAVYIPITHRTGENLELLEVIEVMNPFFTSNSITKIAHNLKFDLVILRRHGFTLNGPFFDTMIASYLIDPEIRGYSLDRQSEIHLKYKMQPISELIGEKKKEQLTFDMVEIDKAVFYAAEDADITFRLYEILDKKLKEADLYKLFLEIEMPLVEVILKMEGKGISLDVEFLNKLSDKYKVIIDELTAEIYKLCSEEFNINSPKQLAVILFEKLNLPKGKKTKTGYSTNSEVLSSLSGEWEVADKILKYRHFTKLKSTYIDALPDTVDKKGFVHTSFSQIVAATGRLSSFNPNLQNIPNRTDNGKEIRKAFVVSDSTNVLISADYSQVELRILAHLANEKNLIEAFRDGEDIHRKTASLCFNIFPEMVTEAQRNMAKTVNFGIVYGQSAFGLAKQIGVTRKEASEFIDAYFDSYPGIKKFMDKTINDAREQGFVKTLMGRKRYLPGLNSSNGNIRAVAERMAINTPVQGSAADIMKIAMINVAKILNSKYSDAYILLQVHDELIIECPLSIKGDVIEIVKMEMETCIELKVSLTVNVGSGSNWLEAH